MGRTTIRTGFSSPEYNPFALTIVADRSKLFIIKSPIWSNDSEIIKAVLSDFKTTNDYSLPNDLWFQNVKSLGVKHNFAESNKIYKQNKDAYHGHVGDVAEIIRISLVGAKNSPNLYNILQILGKDEVNSRIDKVIDYLSK